MSRVGWLSLNALLQAAKTKHRTIVSMSGGVIDFGKSQNPIRCFATVACFIAFCATMCVSLPAQELIYAPREIEKLLRDAETAIANEQWGEATAALGLVSGAIDSSVRSGVASNSQQDYFLPAQANINGQVSEKSVRQIALRMLANLPPEGAEFLDVRYGIDVSNRLQKAVNSNDGNEIESIASQFGFTKAGRQARWLVGQKALADGELTRAAMVFERLASEPASAKLFGSSPAVFAAACWKLNGRLDRAASTFLDYATRSGGARLEWNGSDLPKITDRASAETAVAALELGELTELLTAKSDWLTFNGDLDGETQVDAGLPLPILRWHVGLHEATQLEDGVKRVIDSRENQSMAMLPSRVPIISGDYVFALTYDQRVFAINRRSGKIEWLCFFNDLPVELASDSMFDIMNQGQVEVPQELAERIWANATTGQLSSDGNQLYLLTDSSVGDAADNFIAQGGQRFRTFRVRSKTNVLRAYSIENEGALNWECGGKDGVVDPTLSSCYFLGAPVLHNDQLLVIAEINGEVFLLGLDPKTGKSQFRQQLLANNTVAIADDGTRQGIACMPAISGGVAVCPTLSGYLIGFDLSSRSLLWVHRYSDNSGNIRGATRWNGYVSDQFDVFKERSHENSVLIAKGVVLHAPAEDDQNAIYAVDLITGQRKWRMRRRPYRYIGAVKDNAVLLIGNDRFIAVDLESGSEIYKAVRLEGNAKFSGRGVRDGEYYYVGTSRREVLKIEISTGEIVARSKTEEQLGNLVASDGLIVSLGALQLSAYAIGERVQANIDSLLLNDPTDSTALANQGEILLADGKIEEALSIIEQAYEAAPGDDEIRMLMVKSSIAALQTDFAKYSGRVSKKSELIRSGPMRRLYLFGLVRGFQESGDVVSAFDKLMDYAAELQTRPTGLGIDSDGLSIDSELKINEQRWIAVQGESLWEAADESQRAEITRRVSNDIDRLKELVLAVRLRELGYVERLPASISLRKDTVESLVRIRDLDRSERMLMQLYRSDDAQTRESVAEMLIQIYAIANRPAAALGVAEKSGLPPDRVVETFNESTFEKRNGPPIRGQQWNVPSIDSFIDAPKTLNEWATKVKSADFDLPFFQGANYDVHPIEIECAQGDALQGWRCMQGNGRITLVDPLGQSRVAIQTPNLENTLPSMRVQKAVAIDSMVFFKTPVQVFAVNTLRATVETRSLIWQEAFESDLAEQRMIDQNSRVRANRDAWGLIKPSNHVHLRWVGASSDGVFVMFNEDLICLDIQTGAKQWIRSGLSGEIVGVLSDRTIAVAEMNSGRVRHFDARDGRELRSEKDDSLPKMNAIQTVGRYLLLQSNTRKNNNRKVQIYDPINLAPLLEGEFRINQTKIGINGNSDILLWEPQSRKQQNSKLTYWNLDTMSEYQCESVPNVRPISVHLVSYDDALLVLPHCTGTKFENLDVRFRMQDTGRIYAHVSGPVLALKKSDGQPIWENAVTVFNYSYPLLQTSQSPVIALTRTTQVTDLTGEVIEKCSIGLIDVRNGKKLFHSDHLKSKRGQAFQMQVKPKENLTSISYRGQIVSVEFANDGNDPESIETIGKISREELTKEPVVNGSLIGRRRGNDDSNVDLFK